MQSAGSDLDPTGAAQVGNHITDRPSSRVLAPPGGQSQVFFGDSPPRQVRAPAPLVGLCLP